MLTFRLRWRFAPAPSGLRRLRRLLTSALAHPHYGYLLEAAGLGSRQAIAAASCVNELLQPIALTRLQDLPEHRATVPASMNHPLLPKQWAARAEPGRSRYTTLAGSLARLREIAVLPPRTRPLAEVGVLALRYPGDPEPSPQDLDLLWDAFEVPVYSVFTGFDGTFLAYECEAHSGFHATSDAIFEEIDGEIVVTSLTGRTQPAIRLETGIAGHLETAVCECGRPGLRIATRVPALKLSSAAD